MQQNANYLQLFAIVIIEDMSIIINVGF